MGTAGAVGRWAAVLGVTRTDGEAATEELGRRIGELLEQGDVVSLTGVLGAGKTCLVRGMAEGCGVEQGRVRSPTFVFHHVYRGGRLVLHHIDCYRLGTPADLTFLDLDTLTDTGAVVLEWGEQADLGGYRPLHVTLTLDGDDRRAVSVEAAE